MLCFPAVAAAQVVPPSAQPGRERERFVEPRPARSRAADDRASEHRRAPRRRSHQVDDRPGRRHRIHGLSRSRPRAALRGSCRPRGLACGAVYDIARRITAKYGGDGYVLSRAIVPPQNLGRARRDDPHPGGRGLCRQGRMAGGEARALPRLLHRLRGEDHRRPAGQHPHDRALSAARERPAGPEVHEQPEAVDEQPGRRDAGRRGEGKAVDAHRARRQPRHASARAVEYLGSATVNNMLGVHEAFTRHLCRHVPAARSCNISPATYRQVLNSEGLTGFVNASYSFGKPGTAQLELLEYKTRSTVVEAGPRATRSSARARSNLTLTGLGFMTNDDSDILGAPFIARPPARRPPQGRRRLGRHLPRHQPGQRHVQPGHRWRSAARANDNPSRLAPGVGRVDFTKSRAPSAASSRCRTGVGVLRRATANTPSRRCWSPEQCGYGGRFFGRAFDPSQLLGDHCWEVLGELRYDLPMPWKQI